MRKQFKSFSCVFFGLTVCILYFGLLFQQLYKIKNFFCIIFIHTKFVIATGYILQKLFAFSIEFFRFFLAYYQVVTLTTWEL